MPGEEWLDGRSAGAVSEAARSSVRLPIPPAHGSGGRLRAAMKGSGGCLRGTSGARSLFIELRMPLPLFAAQRFVFAAAACLPRASVAVRCRRR